MLEGPIQHSEGPSTNLQCIRTQVHFGLGVGSDSVPCANCSFQGVRFADYRPHNDLAMW